MGSYELDNENYLHYTGDEWISTTRPLTQDEVSKFKENKLDINKLEWE